MTKHKIFILGMCMFSLALLSMSFVAGTWAKYTSTVSGTDTARVAKWGWEFKGSAITAYGENAVNFDLFNTNLENDNVLDGEGEVIIAPGTSGNFQFEFKNSSEVTAKYSVTFEETNVDNIPIQFSLDGTNWKDTIEDLSINVASLKYDTLGTTHTVYWRWVFDGTTSGAHAGQTDVTDTELGNAGTATVSIKANITFTQVD